MIIKLKTGNKAVDKQIEAAHSSAGGVFESIGLLSYGKKYVVLEVIVFFVIPQGHERVEYSVVTDSGTYASLSAEYFDVVDKSPSKKWVFKLFDSGMCLTIPEFEGYFLDDLTNNDFKTTEKFKKIANEMNREFL